MKTTGGFRGWAIKVDPKGNTSPLAYGLRSPAGLAVSLDGSAFYTENQGDFMGTSKLQRLEADKYYGHPAGLVDLPGQHAKSKDIEWENFHDKRVQAIRSTSPCPCDELARQPSVGYPVSLWSVCRADVRG